MKFGTRVRLKPSNDRGEFELDRTKNNIAENSFALGHETDNSDIFIVSNGYILTVAYHSFCPVFFVTFMLAVLDRGYS